MFYEPSTRTSCSFVAAMQRLGGIVINSDQVSSSLVKGESLVGKSQLTALYLPLHFSHHFSYSPSLSPTLSLSPQPLSHPLCPPVSLSLSLSPSLFLSPSLCSSAQNSMYADCFSFRHSRHNGRLRRCTRHQTPGEGSHSGMSSPATILI